MSEKPDTTRAATDVPEFISELDGGQFVPGLHRFIQERLWEDLPDVPQPSARYRTAPKPLPAPAPEDLATAEDIAALLAPFKPKPRPTE